MASQQSIDLCSIQNARELGGYPASDGRRVKRGVLLRTACLNRISGEDIRRLTDVFHLQHIIDFRMPMELSGAEDPAIDGAEYHHFNVIDLSTFPASQEDQPDIAAPDIVSSVAMSEQIGAMDGRMYIGFLMSGTGKKAYSDFFRVLLAADPDRAVLWHCTSGKDRTGLAAMLLLSLLGVEEEVIVADYLLTNAFNAEHIASVRRSLKASGFDDAFIEKAILVLEAVREHVMRRAIAYLKQEYGSVAGYVRDGLLLSQAEIDSLKEKYLVSWEEKDVSDQR